MPSFINANIVNAKISSFERVILFEEFVVVVVVVVIVVVGIGGRLKLIPCV